MRSGANLTSPSRSTASSTSYATILGCLGRLLKAKGLSKEAGEALEAATYREAIRKKPDDALAHLNLGGILRVQGDFAGSLALIRRGHELGTKGPGWPHASARWVADAERPAALAERLTVVLKGEDPPKDNAERLALAAMCFDRKYFAAAVRLYVDAYAADPDLADGVQPGRRYDAARAAALAGCGRGNDAPQRGG